MSFLLINNATLAVKRVRTVKQAEYWAELECADVDYRIQDQMRRGWAAYSQDELPKLFRSITGRDMPDRNPSSRQVLCYSERVHLVDMAAREMPFDDTPLDELAKRLGREPPTPAEAMAAHIAAGGHRFKGQGIDAAGPDTDGTPRHTRARAESSGLAPARPKAGTTTGRVWDVCDNVLKGDALTSEKALRAAIIAECTSLGIDPSTAATQYSKWNRARKAQA